MNAVQEKTQTFPTSSLVKTTGSLTGITDGKHPSKISGNKLSPTKDHHAVSCSSAVENNQLTSSSGLDSSFSEESKQEILNNILLDLKSGLPEQQQQPVNFNSSNSSISIQEAEESAAQSLLLLGSQNDNNSNNNNNNYGSEWESIVGLLNLHNSTMPPDPPSSVPAVSKFPSVLRKPETLNIPSSGSSPVCSSSLCSTSAGTSHNLPNGTPDFDIGINVNDLGSILNEIAPGLSHDDFSDPDLAVVPTSSASSCQELEFAVRSPTKASNILSSVLSSPSKATHTPPRITSSTSFLVDSLGAIETRNEKGRTKCGTDNNSPPQLSDKKLCLSKSTENQISTKFIPAEIFSQTESGSLEIQQKTVDVFGYKLPRILPLDPMEGDPVFVCIFDIFTNFYKTQHWDAFKSILEKFKVTVRSVRTRNTKGLVEIMEVIEVSQLERLLMANTARKDGFVKCLKLNSRSTGAFDLRGSKIIAKEEPAPAELSSGIRTRHGDHSDISYVEWEGKRLCSLLHDGEEYVRLVDIQKNVLTPSSSNQVTKSQLQKLKATCAQLSVDVKKCYNTQKARMVLYGDSYRSNSLHVITVTDFTKLMACEKNKQLAKSEAKFSELMHRGSTSTQKRSRSGENAEKEKAKKKQKRIGSASDSSFFSAGEEWSSSSSSSSEEEDTSSEDEYSGVESDNEETTSGPSRPNSEQSWSTNASLREKFKKKHLRRENGALIPEEQLAELLSPPVQVPKEPHFTKEERIQVKQCRLCRVVLTRSAPLKLIVANFSGKRGPVGEYYNHLFVSRHSPCVYCYDCRKLISVTFFVKHTHYFCVEEPRIFLHFVDRKRARIDLWQALQRKLVFFRMFNYVYELPKHLSIFYEKGMKGRKKPAGKTYSSNWSGSKSSKKALNHSNSQLTAESANTWFNNKMSELAREAAVNRDNCGPIRAPLIPVKLCPQNYLKRDAWDCVLRRYSRMVRPGKTQVDPLNFVLGSRSPEKQTAIEKWYWLQCEDQITA